MVFMDELILDYWDIKISTFFRKLIKLRKKGPITKNIQQFQKPSLMVKNIHEDTFLNLFMGTLKENIQHEVH
jgi:hypothetical protein